MASEVFGKLLEIQRELKVEKGRYNDFGGFYSRSKEDILEAVKPLAHERGCIVVCEDAPLLICEKWVYICTTATLIDAQTGEKVSAQGYAREPESKPKMDSSQTTGSASSYAGKRALGNLFALDDTADADQIPAKGDSWPCTGECTACGARYVFENQAQFDNSQCQCGNRQFRRV